MKQHSYLTFSLNKQIYGIRTVYVDEIFALPELTTTVKTSVGIVGTINLRGYLLPVVDLNLRFGHPTSDYCLTDILVVLRWEELRVGIIVNTIGEVKSLSSEEIITELYDQQELLGIDQKKIISGIVRNEEEIFILTHPENWFQTTEIQQLKVQENQDNYAVFSQDATLEERAIFRERADNLKLSIESENLSNSRPLTVFALNGQFFGVDLKLVREFTDIRQVTPIPCVKEQIIGNMNWRGEILTLVDLRGFLNIPLMHMSVAFKAMVVEVESIVIGVLVEEVSDVMFFLNPLEIRHAINDEYIQGTSPYRGKMMSILNLPEILLHGGFIVDETI